MPDPGTGRHGTGRLLSRLHDLPDVHVLDFIGFDMLVLPKRAFGSRAEERDWIAEIRRHLP